MKRFFAIVLGLGLAFVLAACSLAESGSDSSHSSPEGEGVVSGEDGYHRITAEEAKEMIDAGDVTIVDVRTSGEYAQAHLPGAVNVPNENIGTEQPEALPNLEDAVIVYCRTGVRSRQAADKLTAMGYTQVYDMGGIVDWSYDTVSEPADDR